MFEIKRRVGNQSRVSSLSARHHSGCETFALPLSKGILHLRGILCHNHLDFAAVICEYTALQRRKIPTFFLIVIYQGFAMATEDRAWYVDFFGADYLNIYRHIFTDERSALEVAFAERVLELDPGASVLDLCCGQGRHSVPLANMAIA